MIATFSSAVIVMDSFAAEALSNPSAIGFGAPTARPRDHPTPHPLHPGLYSWPVARTERIGHPYFAESFATDALQVASRPSKARIARECKARVAIGQCRSRRNARIRSEILNSGSDVTTAAAPR